MGTWDVGILDNDTALDVREEFRELVADGLDPETAVERLVESYQVEPDLSDVTGDVDAVQFWTALAATQVQCGRLSERVKQAVLEIAGSGADGPHWHELPAADQRRRAKAIQKLVAKVTGPQRKPTRIRLPWREQTNLSPGDCLAYQLRSGRWIALRVVAIEEGSPMFDVLEGEWDAAPGPADIATSGHRHTRELSDRVREVCSDLKTPLPSGVLDGPFEDLFRAAVAGTSPQVQDYLHAIRARDGFMVVAQDTPDTLPADRLQPVTTGAATPAPPEFGFPFLFWEAFDEHLSDDYGLE